MKLKLYDHELEHLVEMELCEAPIKMLVANLGSKSQALVFAKAKKYACCEDFKKEIHLIEQEILTRFKELSNRLTPETMNKMPKFYE